ncbi:P-loop containing nucleoside triphosphate hydrolase protein [Trametes elegans]|nr:P-loop containing nucleoside triphosphate hydrolase protein [Trametes elegans]
MILNAWLVDHSVLYNPLLLPAYCGALSLLVLVIFRTKRARQDIAPPGVSYLSAAVEAVGGITIFLFRVVQLLTIQALLVFSILDLRHAQHVIRPLSWAGYIAGVSDSTHTVQCALYVYLTTLSTFSLLGGQHINRHAFVHVSLILASTWGVYMYRDIWPLATRDQRPADTDEGPVMWARLGLLSFGGVVIPLLSPRKCVPLDPQQPMEPHPEQSACLLSLIFYGYMEPLVWLAWRMPRLTYDALPPLPDYYQLKNLVGPSFLYLDPLQNKSRRHIAFDVLRVFWVELCGFVALSLTAVFWSFAAPISVNQLLKYLESDRTGTGIQPWFWILLFFVGKLLEDISYQWFSYNQACYYRLSLRIQAIVTELVFEHSLRIRIKAEASDTVEATSGGTTAVATPDVGSQVVSESSETEDLQTGGVEHTDQNPVSGSGSTGKGKSTQPAAVEMESNAATSNTGGKDLVGRINILVSSDLSNLDSMGLYAIVFFVELPLQVALCIVFLYRILGWSALVGLATMLVTLPLPGYITSWLQGTQREKMKRRCNLSVLNVIRMIKLFGWELRMASQLDDKREKELIWARKSKLLGFSIDMSNYIIPIAVMLFTFTTYTVIMKEQLTLFDMLRQDLYTSFSILPSLVQSKVSLERISDFLRNVGSVEILRSSTHQTELIDEFSEEAHGDPAQPSPSMTPNKLKEIVGIRQASFTWSKDAVAPLTPGGTRNRSFVLHIDEELVFKRGKVNLIVGSTGSGKTSLLMALLGEMHYIPSGPDSFLSLPREGGVAYAAQESWVQNDTIKVGTTRVRSSILAPRLLEQCALKRDLSLFDAGDETEARITLARAVYSKAEILLLDDILAALDVHTAKWIVDKCLKGDLMQDRTIVLVTHNVAMVSPIADFVVDIGPNGRILSQGTLANALEHNTQLSEEVKEEREEIKKAEHETDIEKPEDVVAKQAAGKLVVDEEIEEGHVEWSAMKLFISNMSKRPALFWIVYVSGNFVRHLISSVQPWWLGYWAAQYESHPTEEVSVPYYLTVYSLTVIAGTFASAFCVFYYVYGSVRAARIVHQQLAASLLGTTLRWLDKTPTARIITRCTEDIQTLDNRFARTTEVLVQMTAYISMRMLSVVFFSPIFIIPSMVFAVVSGMYGRFFLKAQLSVKRELSNAKAPVLGHFGAAIAGITSIRAYGAQEAFKKESYRRIDRYSRVSVTHQNLNLWLSSRVQFAGTLFATSLAVYLTYGSNLSASNTGFSLNQATAFSIVINHFIRMFNDWQVAGTLERIKQYLSIEQEPKPTPEGVPPAYWPASGKLEVEKLSARYSSDGPRVLHEVSFEVAAGERVGIVGRTGSGKSSLTLALLRCILTEGNVRYDGLPTDKVNLDALRSHITIIPQVPELLSGTLRQNLDPFSEHDDAVLNDALRSAGLFNLQDENSGRSRITLDTEIAGGGANLSVGQRQILALARAIVRRSKLLILDEDYETDSIIQTSLRTELGADVTLLTVAHRLQTIMDADKIMVLDAGRIVEFGKPVELLRNEEGMLRALVDESGDREKLYQMASAAAST